MIPHLRSSSTTLCHTAALLAAFVGVLHLSSSAPVAAAPVATSDPLRWTNPIVLNRADPHVFLHTDGYYYSTASVPEYDRVELRRAQIIRWRAEGTPDFGAPAPDGPIR